MSDPTQAVFLSYAREDSAAAQRLAEALRAFGIEVWFDQQELRGGDAWDAKIRTQIKSCALFIPIVSTQTEARGEGYFRREWKLAVDRTHDMGAGRAFLVPVVIDDTKEAGADVPEEFLRYQWIRLPGGAPTPQFIEQVKRLLTSPRSGAAKAAPAPTQPAPAVPTPGRKFPVALAAAGLGVAALALGAYFFSRRAAPAAPAPSVAAAPAKPAPVESAAPEISAKSIAVLPFANMSADKDAEFFADGVHEDLLTALAKVRDLKVISRTSVLSYRDASKRNLRQIAAELGVAHILEGSVRRAGNKARITVQLIDARTDQHLWAESYDRDVTDIFGVQGEVAREITSALKATLTSDEATLITRRLTADSRAYDLFVQARVLDQNLGVQSSRQDYERITDLYAAAAAQDPSFVLAHVQEAISHGTQFWFAALDPTEERRAKAFAALERARALAPDAPEVHLAEGALLYLCRNDWRGALAEFRRAQAQLPNDAQLLYRMALALRRVGELPEASSLLRRMVGLSPNDLRGLSTYIETLLALRRYDEVITVFERNRALLAADNASVEYLVFARYARSKDTAAFFREYAAVPPRQNDPFGIHSRFLQAFLRGDLDEASRLLDDNRWTTVFGMGGVLAEPKALHRAEIARLQGRPADAARHAEEAIAYYRSNTWTVRQQYFAKMGIARAKSCAGRHDEAVREAWEALAAIEPFDRFVLSTMRSWAARIFAAADRPDDALKVWRAYANEPGSLPMPQIWATDPFWQRLRNDARYAEIFQPVPSF
jgi:TolB-like protein/Flp pilus assembly protein TadD